MHYVDVCEHTIHMYVCAVYVHICICVCAARLLAQSVNAH